MGGALRVGIVGAGKISGQYSESFQRLPQVQVTAVADLDTARASALAAAHPGARATSLADLLAADDVDVVRNLTIPAAHAEVALAAIAAGMVRLRTTSTSSAASRSASEVARAPGCCAARASARAVSRSATAVTWTCGRRANDSLYCPLIFPAPTIPTLSAPPTADPSR